VSSVHWHAGLSSGFRGHSCAAKAVPKSLGWKLPSAKSAEEKTENKPRNFESHKSATLRKKKKKKLVTRRGKKRQKQKFTCGEGKRKKEIRGTLRRKLGKLGLEQKNVATIPFLDVLRPLS
jgi:hypothetical protein